MGAHPQRVTRKGRNTCPRRSANLKHKVQCSPSATAKRDETCPLRPEGAKPAPVFQSTLYSVRPQALWLQLRLLPTGVPSNLIQQLLSLLDQFSAQVRNVISRAVIQDRLDRTVILSILQARAPNTNPVSVCVGGGREYNRRLTAWQEYCTGNLGPRWMDEWVDGWNKPAKPKQYSSLPAVLLHFNGILTMVCLSSWLLVSECAVLAELWIPTGGRKQNLYLYTLTWLDYEWKTKEGNITLPCASPSARSCTYGDFLLLKNPGKEVTAFPSARGNETWGLRGKAACKQGTVHLYHSADALPQEAP